MAFNKNEAYSEVFGDMPNGHRYTQNGAHYRADGTLCKGSKEPKVKDNVKINKKLEDENAALKAEIKALKAAAANNKPSVTVDTVNTDDLGAKSELNELPIVELLETDIGNSKGKPYKTAESAAATIKTGEELEVIRAKDGFYLRNKAQ